MLQPLPEKSQGQVVQLHQQLLDARIELQAALKKREGQCVLKYDEFRCMSLCKMFLKDLKIYCCADVLEMERKISQVKVAQIMQLEREYLIMYS